MSRNRRLGKLRIVALLALSLSVRVRAGVTPQIQRAVAAATFEVVLRKPAHDPLSYAKPLPRELIPYQQRTDKYRQVGTAFALGSGTYVTAAHVLEAAVDSQYGNPALRGPNGTVYPVASIVKFSMDEDYAVFTLKGAPPPARLKWNQSPQLDEPVFAVGNALGEGIVIRSGLYTSETPETQAGRWQWIRFSAPASPGDSGGPLLDARGKVIGVVIAKSPDENLNYALPIGIVLRAPEEARFDNRYVVRLPFMQGYTVHTLKGGFALPLRWTAFEHAYERVVERDTDQALADFLTAYADTMFPRGNGSDAIVYSTVQPQPAVSVIVQQNSGEWKFEQPSFESTDLPGNGKVSVASLAGATFLRLVRGNGADGGAFYRDSRKFMNEALKGLVIRRQVGPVADRVTSLGPALSDLLWTDRYGRKWQQRVWPLPYLDSYLIALLLPTPDGYVGLIRYSPSVSLGEAEKDLKLLANQVNLVYQGTLAQWSAFLKRRALLPDALAHLSLVSAPTWTLRTPRFQMSVPPALVKLDQRSMLYLAMSYAAQMPRASWEVAGAWWYRGAEKRTYVGLWRQPRPPRATRRSLQYTYANMQRRISPFNGQLIRVAPDEVTSTTVLQAPGSRPGTASAGVLYGLTIGFQSEVSVGDISEKQMLAVASTHILEHGIGANASLTTPAPDLKAQLEDEVVRLQQMAVVLDPLAGKDLLGRSFSQDVDEYIVAAVRKSVNSTSSSASTTKSSPLTDGIASVYEKLAGRYRALQGYWRVVPAMMRNRDLWPSFLARNNMPPATPHGPRVLAAEAALRRELAGSEPDSQWAKLAISLDDAYVTERDLIASKRANEFSGRLQPRTIKCPAPAASTSGHDAPAIAHTGALYKYYPSSMQRAGIEGAVILKIRIDATGCVTAMAVAGSSGSNRLDQAALRWVQSASYLPAERDGRAIPYTALQPVNFALSQLPFTP